MAKRHALVIGNSSYLNQDEFPTIEYAKNDACRIHKLLTNSATSIFSDQSSNCILNITRDDLDDVLDEFFEGVSRKDLVLVYFAGHAKVLPGKKRLFLAMTDTNPKKLARSAFNVDSLLPYFEEHQINRYIVILDCCRSGMVLETAGIRHRGLINDAELQNVSGRGKVFVASSLEYQLSHELKTLKHGLFSHYFIHGIETGEAVECSQRFINISDLSIYIQKQIEKQHPDISQEPVMTGTDVIGELVVAKNPKYNPEDAHEAEILEFIKRSLNEDDLSDKGKVQRARVRKLHSFFKNLADLNVDFTLAKHIAIEYGQAIGLKKQVITAEFDEYSASLKFSKVQISDDLLRSLNGKGQAFFFSTAYSFYAYESQEFRSSLFAYYFCEALKGLGANSDGLVTLTSAYNYLDLYVQSYDSFRQKPMLVAKMFEDPVLTAEGVDWSRHKGRRVAILVGVDFYNAREFAPLRYAQSDAEQIAYLLESKGGFECIKILGTDATRANVEGKLYNLLHGLSKEDFVIFFFTGHGFSLENEGYAALYDTQFIPSAKFVDSLQVTNLSRIVNSSNVGTFVVILDACMSPARPSDLLVSAPVPADSN